MEKNRYLENGEPDSNAVFCILLGKIAFLLPKKIPSKTAFSFEKIVEKMSKTMMRLKIYYSENLKSLDFEIYIKMGPSLVLKKTASKTVTAIETSEKFKNSKDFCSHLIKNKDNILSQF